MRENLAPFFSPAGFGSRVLVDDGRAFEALLIRPSEERLGVVGREAALRCGEAALPLVAGQVLTIAGASYVVRRVRPDGTGLVRVELETV